MFLQANSNMLREGLSQEMASAETRRHKPRDQHKDYSQEQLTGKRLLQLLCFTTTLAFEFRWMIHDEYGQYEIIAEITCWKYPNWIPM